MPVLLACLLVACCAGHVAAGARVGGSNGPMDGSPDQYGQGKTRRLASCGSTGSRSLGVGESLAIAFVNSYSDNATCAWTITRSGKDEEEEMHTKERKRCSQREYRDRSHEGKSVKERVSQSVRWSEME